MWSPLSPSTLSQAARFSLAGSATFGRSEPLE